MKYCPECSSPLSKKEIGGRSRPACPEADCGWVFWDNPVPVVAALVDLDGNVLRGRALTLRVVELDGNVLLVRDKNWPDRIFGLVTGFLERGETPEEAVLREVKEEIGLEGVIEQFIGHYPFTRMNQLILAFHVKAAGNVTLGSELAESKLIPPGKLRPWPFGTGLAVRDWLDARSETQI